jgi:hypothetical protein
MAAKSKRKAAKNQSTDWDVGQPLAFPPSRVEIEGLARKSVDETVSKRKQRKRKKK